jgi:hypothetical protein
MRYNIRRFTIYRSSYRSYIVEVYNPSRGKKHRKYERLGFERICKLCDVLNGLAAARYGHMSIVPGHYLMSVEVELV